VTFFQRIKTPFTEGAADEQVRLPPRTRLSGDVLQERREDLGLDLDEVGAMLRIKPAYLAALEQGRSHDLPGPTYAIGFVRAYADFLGLDAEEVLARFKAESSVVTVRPDLALPVPLGERSLPGGALVLVALIVALCGYGIWYYLSTEERGHPERVAAVPAALQAPPSGPVLVTPPAPGGSPSSGETTAAPSTPPAPSLYGAAAPAPGPLTGPLTAPSGGAAPMPPPAIGANPQPAAPPRATLAAGAPSAAPPGAPSAPAQQAAPPQAAPQSAAASSAPASAAPAPAAGAKVTIKAVSDCWIQVRAADQSIVFSRVLKAGEVYSVPARPGLSLRTGNAGALEIAIDGKPVPSIGGIGALRRDVVLDPAELAAGTAVHG